MLYADRLVKLRVDFCSLDPESKSPFLAIAALDSWGGGRDFVLMAREEGPTRSSRA